MNFTDYSERFFANGDPFEWRETEDGETFAVPIIEKECPECYGKGTVEYSSYKHPGHTRKESCDKCDGIGVLFSDGNPITADEFKAWQHQRSLLRRRYGTPNPKSVADYFKPAMSS